MKKLLLVAGLVVVVLAAALVVALKVAYRGQPLPTSIEEAKCALPITVQGPVMEPAIKSGSRLLLDKCADRQNIAAGTIVLFQQGNAKVVGRVKERTGSGDAVSYTVGQDGRPDAEFVVPAERIIATGR